ncbi:MAG: RagB/SusD family nutrient uptake outer membrane protein, partial [Candidatus Azobacteroides sp.]|nr:RagB/SusD family nutrient uptake outer membrane protein [Candidatus Azobacteroides sp.]
MCTYTFTSEHVYFESLWSDLYTIIMRANIIIRVCEEADFLEEADRQRMMCEALFLRAHAYYYLVCFWGNVPLITEAMEKFDYTLPRASLHQVYQQITEDLEYASVEGRLTEERRSDLPSRVSRYAAKGLLGKIYLTMASYKESGKVEGYDRITETVRELYQKANQELKDIILTSSFELVIPYSAAFEISEKSGNKEALFEIFFGPGELGSGWSRDAYGGYGDGNGIDLRLYGSYCGKRNMLPVGSFVRTYQNGDSRYNWNIQDSTIVLNNGVWSRARISNVESMFIPKFRQGAWNEILSHGYGQCENNYPILRYADVLLMYVETELKLNNGTATENAVREINKVIQRARYPKVETDTPEFPDYTINTLTFEALMAERARELCYEPHRKIDLLRTGRLEEALENSSYKDPLTNFQSFHYLYPIPAY